MWHPWSSDFHLVFSFLFTQYINFFYLNVIQSILWFAMSYKTVNNDYKAIKNITTISGKTVSKLQIQL